MLPTNFDVILVLFQETGKKAVDHSDKLYNTLMKLVRESHTKLNLTIREGLEKSEQKDKKLMAELQEEVTCLQGMKSKLQELSQTEDHLHLLQVGQHFYNYKNFFKRKNSK